MDRDIIKCNTIPYRKGYIEIRGDIHNNCINLEVWNIDPDFDITDLELPDERIPDSMVSDNTEIEIPIEKAELLIEQLTNAIIIAKNKSS